MSYNNPNEKTYGHPDQSPHPQYSPQPGYPVPQPGAYQQPPYPHDPAQYQQQQPVYHQEQPVHHQQSPQPQDHQAIQQQYHQQPQPEQPKKQPPMSNDKGHKANAHGERQWENGMCDCFSDMGSCCKGYWCPCMTYSTIQYRIRHNGDMSGYSNCNGACCGWTCLTYFGCQWILSMIQRGDIRAKHNLAGSGCGDCSRHYWCGCCTLIQEDKETKMLVQQNVNQGGYHQQGGMNYAPQH